VNFVALRSDIRAGRGAHSIRQANPLGHSSEPSASGTVAQTIMDISVEVHCAGCGSANYSLPSGVEGDAPVICNDCGRTMGTIAHLKEELMSQIAAHSAESLRREIERTDSTEPA
jgi:hypothetical protein